MKKQRDATFVLQSRSWKSTLVFLPPVVLLAALVNWGSQVSQSNFGTQEELDEIKADLQAVTCSDSHRLDAAKALFEKMGAPASDLSIQTQRGVRNLVVIKRGTSDERIVVGAHYDKTYKGCGAIDNWTDIVAIAHIYKTLKSVPLTKTLIFVAFGKEEHGLVGSHAMADAISTKELRLYCGMVNVDSLGLAIPQVADNLSAGKLEALSAGLAKEMGIKYSHAPVEGGLSDSHSFLVRGIPALTIHGLSSEWKTILHTDADQRSKVNPASVYLGYRLALAVVEAMDKALCDAFR